MDLAVRVLRFSVFELDLERRELRRRGVRVPLPPQPFAVLELLLRNAGQLVTREELRLALWPDGVHVDHERGLNYCVNRVRRALGDTAQVPRFLETLPRRGYRFLADVEVVRGGENRAAHRLCPDATLRAEPPAPTARVARARRPLPRLAATLLLAAQGQPQRHSEPGKPGRPRSIPPRRSRSGAGANCSTRGPRDGGRASPGSRTLRAATRASRSRATAWRTPTCAWARTACSRPARRSHARDALRSRRSRSRTAPSRS